MSVKKKNKCAKNILNILIAMFCVMFMCTGCFAGYEEDDEDFGIEVYNLEMIVEYNEYLGYTAVIKGTAINNSGINYSYVDVEFTIYDEFGNNLGTALDNINNLAKGDTWNFEANLFDYPTTRPATYKFVGVTAW